MNHKFFILLSVAIFYNGVLYASPVNNLEGTLPEEKPPTASPVNIYQNKKLELAHAPTTPDILKTSVSLSQTEIAHTDASTAHIPPIPVSVPPHITEPKNVTRDATTGNVTTVISQKNSTLVAGGKNASQAIDNKNIDSVNGPKGTVSTGVPDSVSASTLAPTAPSAVVPEKPTTISITSATLNANPTTVKTNPTTVNTNPAIVNTNPTTVNTPTLGVTRTPNSTTSDKVFVVDNVVTPVQEKHFDGPSFIGGIVLTIGLTAIGFIAFKYYKAGKIDMNYRTL